MSVSQRNEEHPRLDRGQLKKWDKPIQDLLIHLVNEEGVRYRMPDAGHVLLYPPDGTSRPFKCAASRPAERSVHYLESQFMAPYGVRGPDGAIPGAEQATGGPESPAVDQEPTQVTDEAAMAALRTLATSLGVSLGGGVSDEEHLVVVAERDALNEDRLRVQNLYEEAVTQIADLTETCAAITAQRDDLLEAIDTAVGALTRRS